MSLIYGELGCKLYHGKGRQCYIPAMPVIPRQHSPAQLWKCRAWTSPSRSATAFARTRFGVNYLRVDDYDGQQQEECQNSTGRRHGQTTCNAARHFCV
jgi:hypothetical protein